MYAKLIEKIQEHRLRLVELGGMLKEAKESEIWKDEIGEGIDTWYDFVAQPEIGFTVTEADMLISMYELDIIAPDKVQFIPTNTLKYLIKKGGDIDDAMVLTTKDFKKKYFDSKRRGTETFKYMIMKVSDDGTMSRVFNVEELQIAKHQIING